MDEKNAPFSNVKSGLDNDVRFVGFYAPLGWSVVAWSITILLTLLPFVLLIGAAIQRDRAVRRRNALRRQQQISLAAERKGESIDSFASQFTGSSSFIAAGAVYSVLSRDISTVGELPIRPTDSLAGVFGIYTPNGPNIDHIVTTAIARIGINRYGENWLANRTSPRTVADLVRIVSLIHQENTTVDLLRACDAPVDAMLLKPAYGGAKSDDPDMLVRTLDSES